MLHTFYNHPCWGRYRRTWDRQAIYIVRGGTSEDHLMSEHQSGYINGEISLTTGELTWLDELV